MGILGSGIFQSHLHSYEYDIIPVDADAFFAGESGMIGYVKNSNITYVSPSGYSAKTFIDIDFDSTRQYGFALTTDGLVFESSDYGASWALAYTTDLADARVIKVSPQNWVYVGGSDGSTTMKAFRKTGTTYQALSISSPVSGPVEDFCFHQTNLNFAKIIHNTRAYSSSDSGTTYPINENLSLLGFIHKAVWNDSNAITIAREFSSSQGMVFDSGFTVGYGFNFGASSEAKSVWGNWGNPRTHFSFANGYVGRASGTTVEYMTQLFSTSSSAEKLDFRPNALEGYVCVGTRIYETTNSGNTWSLVTSAITNNLRSIKAI